ncbi:MAG TPA: hypothetical protein VF322_04135 [Gammaproteobacteria bacterium]
MLARLRIALLLYALVFVAAAHYFARERSTDWDDSLWVTIYPVNSDGRAETQAYVERLDAKSFAELETFFAAEARRHGVALERPFRFQLAPPADVALPSPPDGASPLAALLFSLRLRWCAAVAAWNGDLPSADISVFAAFHAADAGRTLERSAGLAKGLVAVASRGPRSRSATVA